MALSYNEIVNKIDRKIFPVKKANKKNKTKKGEMKL